MSSPICARFPFKTHARLHNNIQKTRKFQHIHAPSSRCKNSLIRPNRNLQRIRAIDPDIIVTSSNVMPYAQFQLASWILPMTIAGRLLKMEYDDICRGLLVIAVTKSILYALQIIHY